MCVCSRTCLSVDPHSPTHPAPFFSRQLLSVTLPHSGADMTLATLSAWLPLPHPGASAETLKKLLAEHSSASSMLVSLGPVERRRRGNLRRRTRQPLGTAAAATAAGGVAGKVFSRKMMMRGFTAPRGQQLHLLEQVRRGLLASCVGCPAAAVQGNFFCCEGLSLQIPAETRVPMAKGLSALTQGLANRWFVTQRREIAHKTCSPSLGPFPSNFILRKHEHLPSNAPLCPNGDDDGRSSTTPGSGPDHLSRSRRPYPSQSRTRSCSVSLWACEASCCPTVRCRRRHHCRPMVGLEGVRVRAGGQGRSGAVGDVEEGHKDTKRKDK